MVERAFRRALPLSNEPSQETVPVLVACSDSTPTSSLLPPVEERRFTRRRRRASRPNFEVKHPNGFPVPRIQEDLSGSTHHTRISAFSVQSMSHRDEILQNGISCNSMLNDDSHAIAATSLSRHCRSTLTPHAQPCKHDTEMMKDISEENIRRISAMSKDEIEQEIRDLHERFGADFMDALKERGKQKESQLHNASIPKEEATFKSRQTNKKVSFASETDSSLTIDDMISLKEDDGDSGENGLVLSDTVLGIRTLPYFAENGELARKLAKAVSLQNVPERDVINDEKLEWTASVDDPAVKKRSAALDAAIRKSVEALGEVADWRFDLTGRQLSAEEIESLPFHIGLHHHGTQPNAAGYTLGDLILLTRSSVLGQRTIAMNVLSHAISRYGDKIVTPLQRSGGLDAIISVESPSGNPELRSQHASHARAYVSLAHALAEQRSREVKGAQRHAISSHQLYFMSELYCAPLSLPQDNGVFNALARNKCICYLVSIAFRAHLSGDWETANLALDVCIDIASAASDAGLAVVESAESASALFSIILSASADDVLSAQNGASSRSDKLNTRAPVQDNDRENRAGVIFRACKVASLCAAVTCWNGMTDAVTNAEGFLSKCRLRMISRYISNVSALRTSDHSRTARLLLSFGALRVFRAAITFGHGLDVLKGLLSNMLIIVRQQTSQSSAEYQDARLCLESCAAEAYLTLETYCHALYTGCIVGEHENSGSTEPRENFHATSKDGDDSRQEEQHEEWIRIQLMKQQLRDLVPTALEAASVFSTCYKEDLGSERNQEIRLLDLTRAAAGHFAATVLAMTSGAQVFLAPDVVNRICMTGEVSLAMARTLCRKDCYNVDDVVIASSVAHASARILSRACCPPDMLHNAVTDVTEVVDACTSKSPSGVIGSLCSRVVVNSAAEWIGLLSRRNPNVANVSRALKLLSRCTDGQVAGDVIARNFLSPRVICAISSEIGSEEASELCKTLLPYTLGAIVTHGISTGTRKVPELKLPLSSYSLLFSFWVACEDELELERAEAGAKVLGCLYDNRVITCDDVYQAILIGTQSSLLLSRPTSYVAKVLMAAGRSCEKGSLLPSAMHCSESASSLSPTDESPVRDKLMSLCEALINRGPGDEGTAVAASVLCTVMLRNDMDLWLRRRLWESSIVDCGGAALYQHAELHGDVSLFIDNDGKMTDLYARVLSRGLRCTNVSILQALWGSIARAILKGNSRRTDLSPLLDNKKGRRLVHQALVESDITMLPVDKRNVISSICGCSSVE